VAPSLAVAHPATADFFPATSGIIKNAAPQLVGYAKDGMVLRLTPGAKANGTLQGLLVLTGTDGSTQALEVSVPPGPVPAVEFSAPAATSDGDLSLGGAGLRLPGRADPERHALRAADPGDEGACLGRSWRARTWRKLRLCGRSGVVFC